MRRLAEEHGVEKIAMPKIGCGLDRLHWPDVEARIRSVFDDTEDVEILVVMLPEKKQKG